MGRGKMSDYSATADVPFIPASKIIPEITIKSVLLGIVLGIVLAAANTYLGLYAGMTVSASIPAAVISMGILRGLFKTGTILENNIVQTIASTGESLSAGIIFTVPALLLTGVWTEIKFWPTTLICISGGLLGIVFMIPLRKIHIVEDKTLKFPEGVACGEVLKAGEKGGAGVVYLTVAMGLGALLKFVIGGVSFLKGTVEWTMGLGKSALYFGTDISVALLGVGYIVGFNIATLVLLGGLLAWAIALPILGLATGIEGNALDWFWTTWSSHIRFMGVGAMVVGGLWSIISIRSGMVRGFREALLGYKQRSTKKTPSRTETDMGSHHILMILLAVTIGVFLLYNYLVGSLGIATLSTVAMIVLSFFFVAVASYIVGLVGSSNSPVSGMTICAVLVTAGMLLLVGMTGPQAMLATLGVAGVVCCATCTAGDISQDLKTGHILGATPKKQQWMEIVGATIPALFIAPVLIVLNQAYGIGTRSPSSLKAPQATLFASIAKAFFGDGSIPWNWVFIGAAIGVGIIIFDQVLKAKKTDFRMPIMAVAVGIYLPLTLSIPIFLGGLIAAATHKHSKTGSGVLFASGLIAGEALMGVLLGIIIYMKRDLFPITIFESALIPSLLSIATLLGIGLLMMNVAKREA